MIRRAFPTRRASPFALLSLSIGLATLAACGGGGSDAPPAAAPAPLADATPITVANANQVAARGYDTANGLYDATVAASSQLKSVDGGPVRLDLVGRSLARLRALAADLPSAGIATKATSTATEPCSGGGRVVAQVNDVAGDGVLNAGDTATVTFQACNEGGLTVDGSMGFVVQAYALTATAESATATVTFTNLRVSDGSLQATANGDMTLGASISRVSPFITDVTLSGNRLETTDGAVAATIAAYSGRLVQDDTRRTSTYTVTGQVSGTGLPGTLTISTPTPIAAAYGQDPTLGVLLVRGANGGSVRMSVTPPTGVSIAVDVDGDGALESTQALSWAQLDAL